MMYYFFQVNLLLIALYSVYILVFRGLTFHTINRFILLFIPVFSLLIPLIPSAEMGYYSANYILPTVSNYYQTAQPYAKDIFSLNTVITWIYLVGLFVFTSNFIAKIISLSYYLIGLKYTPLKGLKVSFVKSKYQSFSFFNYVVINKTDKDRTDIILKHENLHNQLYHSTDKLYFELLSCVFWFNPIMYLLKKEVKNNHEFEVDAILTMNKNFDDYIGHLKSNIPVLKEQVLSNSFLSKSNLLKRIIMMNKKPSSQIRKLNYLLFLPLLISALLFVACAEQVKDEIKEVKNVSDEVVREEGIKELDKMPLFAGGVEELYKFMADNIKYPSDAKKEGISGTVYVSFVIDKNGAVTKAKVEKDVYPSLDAEALRVVNSMPNWSPGKKGDKVVPVELVLPISFKLDDKASLRKRNGNEKEFNFIRYIPRMTVDPEDNC